SLVERAPGFLARSLAAHAADAYGHAHVELEQPGEHRLVVGVQRAELAQAARGVEASLGVWTVQNVSQQILAPRLDRRAGRDTALGILAAVVAEVADVERAKGRRQLLVGVGEVGRNRGIDDLTELPAQRGGRVGAGARKDELGARAGRSPVG